LGIREEESKERGRGATGEAMGEEKKPSFLSTRLSGKKERRAMREKREE